MSGRSRPPVGHVQTGRAQMRVIDDEFAVNPGQLWFKDCNTGAVNLICEMKKP